MAGIGGSIERVTDDDRLRGVRGWLLFPPVIIVLTLLGHLLIAIQLLAYEGPSATEAWVGLAMMATPLVPLGIFALVRLFQERKSARMLMIIYFVIYLAFGLLIFANAESATDEGLMVAYSGLRNVIISIVIIAYLFFSKRVKLTLVNDKSGPVEDVF